MLSDVQNEADKREVAIRKVGVRDLNYPVTVLDKTNGSQHTVANINMFVDLPHHYRGTHMSRFVEVLERHTVDLHPQSLEEILDDMNGVRFKFKKSGYILEARDRFFVNGNFNIKEIISSYSDVSKLRDWLVSEIKGIGLKEAGHFLRNIGFGKEIAILDRHILKNLKKYSVIDDYPASLSRGKYLEIEERMLRFAENIGIPPDHLDLLFWFREAGKIFK